MSNFSDQALDEFVIGRRSRLWTTRRNAWTEGNADRIDGSVKRRSRAQPRGTSRDKQHEKISARPRATPRELGLARHSTPRTSLRCKADYNSARWKQFCDEHPNI